MPIRADTTSNGMVARIGLAALPSAPYWARCHTRNALIVWGIDKETVETAQLLVSELVTNAARAEGVMPPPLARSDLAEIAKITLTLRYTDRSIRIEVADSNPRPPTPSITGPDDESGRGLILVDALSSEWSFYLLPSEQGKVVYCVLDTAEPTLRTD